MINELVVFIVKVPLVKGTIFDLYHLIPLPIQHKNSSIFSFIVPRNPYIILSQSESYFIVLPELKNCNEYLEGKYLCMHRPTYNENHRRFHMRGVAIAFTHGPSTTRLFNADHKCWSRNMEVHWKQSMAIRPTETNNLDSHLRRKQGPYGEYCFPKRGILQVHSHCKGYTMLYSLEPTSQVNKNILFLQST